MSESTRKRNPHLFGAPAAGLGITDNEIFAAIKRLPGKPVEKRLRQDPKPLMNKLEQSWFNYLTAEGKTTSLRAQAKRFRIANGAWYKPDITGVLHAGNLAIECAWECKGPKQMKNMARAMLTIKVAAAQWPEVRWTLVWKEHGEWKQQLVLP